ncbi:MAG: MerR family transcriptional regulator [Candidatus Babeliaceae bacterium]|nr:MerR family transcriptional regulator [Candidatus Babeliaceae bacterium]
MKKRKGYFSISAVAQMFSIHQQTIRLYEKEGFISPKRSEGNTRLFSEEDITRLEEIIHLTHNIGINLAGVEMILKLQKKIKTLQGEMNSLFSATQKDFENDMQETNQALKVQAAQLATIARKRTKREPAKLAGGAKNDTE